MSAASRRCASVFALAISLMSLGVVGGCAKKPLPDYGSAAQAWSVFNAHYRVQPPAPAFVVSSSLAWTSGKKSARILLDIWGDFAHVPMLPAVQPEAVPTTATAKDTTLATATAPTAATEGLLTAEPETLPDNRVIRMDAWSNLGGSLSQLREGADGLAAFYPDQLKAYTHADPVIGARLLGLPFPFSLADFAALLYGDFSELLPQHYDSVKALPQGGWRYEFRHGRVSSLSLDAAARPLSMSGQTSVPAEYEDKLGGQWSIDFSNYPEATGISTLFENAETGETTPSTTDSAMQAPQITRAPMAERLFLTLPGDHRGSLRIQSRELKLQSWPDEAMTLNLPEGVEARALDGVQRDWTTGRVAGEELGSTPLEQP